MKKSIVQFTNHHFDPRFILTPIASTVWDVKGNITKRFIYVFGIRIVSYSLTPKR